MGRKRSTFVDFLDKNDELVEEYEQIVGEDLWSIPIQEADLLAAAIASKLKIGFNAVVHNCINNAIQTRTPLIKIFNNLAKTSENEFSSDNLLQKYFKEINDAYLKHDNDYNIPFCKENRDKIITMNLKSVIAIAKCYQGLGVEFEDLISAGNEGLCRAFEKYDPKRARLKDDIVLAIEENNANEFTYNELYSIIVKYLTYGETIKKAFDLKFKPNNIYKKIDIIKWIDKNVHNAKFNSVACKWIKAYIIQEINNNSRVVKKPKAEIDKDKNETGAYTKEVIVNIDSPISNENVKTIGDIMSLEDTTITKDSLENEENYKYFKNALNLLLTGVKSRDRRIILKKFGIGIIRPLQPIEIAAQEGLSVARISQIINLTIEQMIKNSKTFKNQLNPTVIFDTLKKLV